MAGPKYGDFEFPSSFGFTGSASDKSTTTVRSHERRKPGFAKGGAVRKAMTTGAALGAAAFASKKKKDETDEKPKPRKNSILDHVRGKTRRQKEQELGLKSGGSVRKAKGGFNRTPLYGK